MTNRLTPEKCREHAGDLRAMLIHESNPERRRKFEDLIKAWEDLCADLERSG
jgi:hypothetical protein